MPLSRARNRERMRVLRSSVQPNVQPTTPVQPKSRLTEPVQPNVRPNIQPSPNIMDAAATRAYLQERQAANQ